MRIGYSCRPQSRASGRGRSRYWVSTVPTEPAAAFGAGVVMRAIISSPGNRRALCRCMIRSLPKIRTRTGPLPGSRGLAMATSSVDNGVNVQALLDAREVLKGAPEAAKFTWRASCKWQNGTHSKANINGFFGLGQEQQHKTETSFDADHPEI